VCVPGGLGSHYVGDELSEAQVGRGDAPEGPALRHREGPEPALGDLPLWVDEALTKREEGVVNRKEKKSMG